MLKEAYINMDIERFLTETAPQIDKAVEKYIPRKFSKNSILFKVAPPMYSYNLEPLNKAIADPIWDMLDRGGKRWRPALFLLICEALGKKDGYCTDFAVTPKLSTTAHRNRRPLILLRDASRETCTNKIYQLDISVNAGNAMYYLPLLPIMENRDKLSAEAQRDVYEIYVQEMINLSMGQAMDIAWHRGIANADALSEQDYLQMCAYKTGRWRVWQPKSRSFIRCR
jgi:geranylgeranyl pyrophosphate synthase